MYKFMYLEKINFPVLVKAKAVYERLSNVQWANWKGIYFFAFTLFTSGLTNQRTIIYGMLMTFQTSLRLYRPLVKNCGGICTYVLEAVFLM